MNRMTLLFLILAVFFAATHFIAVEATLYWYYSWFDIVMHVWGGVLIVLGIHVFSDFTLIKIKPTWPVTITILLVTVISWEIFEWLIGFSESSSYVMETSKDIAVGLGSGLLTQLLITINKV